MSGIILAAVLNLRNDYVQGNSTTLNGVGHWKRDCSSQTDSLQQPLAEVERRVSLASSKTSRLERRPIHIIDTDFVVPTVMRVRIRENLPVEPRDTSSVDLARPSLDIVVARTRAERRTTIAVVVRSVSVASTPLLHDELLATVLGLGDIFVELRGREVTNTVGVDGNHVEGGAGEVCVLSRSCEV
jgi:hypothetical protein